MRRLDALIRCTSGELTVALTERSRSEIYTGLSSVLSAEAVEEMLSYFPARDVEEPVTREFLRAEIADVRAEVAEMRGAMSGMQSEMSGMKGEMAEMRMDMRDMRLQIVGIHDALRKQAYWLVGLVVTVNAATVALLHTLS